MIKMSVGSRDLTLDFVKGILVIVMVIYHAMNIFSTAGPEAYGYIRFVSGSFLFISGYIIAIFYEQKFNANKVVTAKRLVLRGIKLLMIFTVLNIAINLTGVGNPSKTQLGVQHYLSNLSYIYGLGRPGTASFQILLPIAYLLMISPLFLLLRKIRLMLALTSLVAAFCLSYFGVESVNFGLGIIGIIGFYGGMLVNKYQGSFSITSKPIILAGILVSFFMMSYLDRNVLTYAVGIMLVIKLFYDLGMAIDLRSLINRVTILLGQYSLVCYIVQIVFLQGLSIALSRQKWELGYEIFLLVLITNLLLVALCYGLAFLRTRYWFIEQSYRFIFA